VSNAGAVSAAVSDGEKLATVRTFAQDVFDGLEEEPLGKGDLSGAACAFASEGCDDDFLGCAGKGGERQGFKFGGGLGAAKETFHAADFVEVGHARGSVSKWKMQERCALPFQAWAFGSLGPYMAAHPTVFSVLLREADPVVCPPACESEGESKIRIWRVVQAWLGFAGRFLNMLKIKPCFFKKP
jgi:hypothetical protein